MIALAPHSAAVRFVRYGAVGVSGVGVNVGAFWLLASKLQVAYVVASPVAIELALCTNYLLHNCWTFADRRSEAGFHGPSGFLRFQAVSFGGLLINLAALHVLASAFGLPTVLGNLAGIGLATIWNFGLSLRWAWPNREAARA